MNKAQAIKLKHTKLKAYMMRYHNDFVELTSEELDILAQGMEPLPEGEAQAMLMQMRVPEYLQVVEAVKDCCKYSIMFFDMNNKMTSDNIVENILDLDKHYKDVLQYIKPIKRVEEPVAYNSKL